MKKFPSEGTECPVSGTSGLGNSRVRTKSRAVFCLRASGRGIHLALNVLFSLTSPTSRGSKSKEQTDMAKKKPLKKGKKLAGTKTLKKVFDS